MQRGINPGSGWWPRAMQFRAFVSFIYRMELLIVHISETGCAAYMRRGLLGIQDTAWPACSVIALIVDTIIIVIPTIIRTSCTTTTTTTTCHHRHDHRHHHNQSPPPPP